MNFKKKSAWLGAIILTLFVCLTPRYFASAMPTDDPAQVPRMVTVSFYGDTQSEIAFNWNTTAFTDSDAEVAPYNAEGSFASGVISTSGEYEISKASSADGFVHTCVVKGLSPATKYIYRVGDKELGVWSKTGSFVTASASDEKFTFLHLSDPQGWEKIHYDAFSKLLKSAVELCSPAFLTITGDVVNNSWEGYVPTLEQWEWALTEQFPYIGNYPVMAVAGNHDAASYDFSSRFNYAVPENASEETGSYYSFDYNGAHFLAINSNDTLNRENSDATGLSETQYNWIKNDLREHKDSKWKIAMLHKGLYDSGSHSNNTDGTDYDIALIRKQLAPLFTEYGVDLVLQGHDHLYSKTYPLTVRLENDVLSAEKDNAKTVTKTYDNVEYLLYDDPEGVIYLNSGSASGSKFYVPVGYDTELIEKTENTGCMMYSSVTLDKDVMLVRTYTLNNKNESVPYYTFGILKESAPAKNPNTLKIVLISVGSVLAAGAVAVAAVLLIKKKKRR